MRVASYVGNHSHRFRAAPPERFDQPARRSDARQKPVIPLRSFGAKERHAPSSPLDRIVEVRVGKDDMG